mmetsp:Transcript_112358/g.350116  ORF Transcript_112358/g.350116 Transcript_112358/m.350116 type:complete len:197 (+) Transcript_112358:110-700(+)
MVRLLLALLHVGCLAPRAAAAAAGLDDASGLLQAAAGVPAARSEQARSWVRCTKSERATLRPMLRAVTNSSEEDLRQLFASAKQELKKSTGVGVPGLSLAASLPASCKGITDGHRYDRDLHIECFQKAFSVSPRCAACTVDFWYNMLFACHDYCKQGLHDVMCRTCSPPSKFQECYVAREPVVVTVGLEGQDMLVR